MTRFKPKLSRTVAVKAVDAYKSGLGMAEKVQGGTPAARIIAEEEKLHAKVQARAAADLALRSSPRSSTHSMGADLDRQLISLRDAINDAKPEDLAPLVEQMTRLAALRGQLGNSKTLPIDSHSPYFAHMVLREDKRVRDVLIGKRGFIDRKANIQIVDWRNAPISQIYYRYDEGDDFEEEIAGKLACGIVETRRNLSISKATLKRIGSPQGTFVLSSGKEWRFASGDLNPTLVGGQGSAARAPRPTPKRVGRGKSRTSSQLGFDFDGESRADKHLPEIAALIDGEQFDLITRPSSGIVAIQGGAGSGKTTVALHRIAYLAFSDKRYNPRKFLFVVPSNSLVRYVVDVLPALGVHGVPVLTYTDWATKTRQRILGGGKGTYNDDTPEAVSRIKKHPRIEDAIQAYVGKQIQAIESALGDFGNSEDVGEIIITQWQLLERNPLVPRLRKLAFWARKAPIAVEAKTALESFCRRAVTRADDLGTDWGELLTDEALLTQVMKDAPHIHSSDVSITIKWTSRQLDEVTDERASNAEDTTAGCLDHEDDPILLRLAQVKRGGLFDSKGKQITYQHVAIDEVQDRSAIETRVLIEAVEGSRDQKRKRSITLAGDMAQRVVFDNAIESWDELLDSVGLSGTEVSPLAISYRSTAEVMALAREILGPELDSKDPLVARSGRPVEIHELGNAGEAVGFLADSLRSLMGREPTASVAVLARYPEQADIYYAGLVRAEVPYIRRVRRDDFSFQPGIDVTETSQVKGLEFDYVILVDVNASSYSTNREARHLLHIGATRAAHQLWIITTGKPSPLLPESI